MNTWYGKGRKNDAGKPRWSLLPWAEMEEVAKVLAFGAQKYAPGNWKRVKDGHQRYFDAALRHMAAIGQNERNDAETGLNHHAHAICSLLFAFWHHRYDLKHRRANDDGPNYGDGS